jgi:hypothetical protein
MTYLNTYEVYINIFTSLRGQKINKEICFLIWNLLKIISISDRLKWCKICDQYRSNSVLEKFRYKSSELNPGVHSGDVSLRGLPGKPRQDGVHVCLGTTIVLQGCGLAGSGIGFGLSNRVRVSVTISCYYRRLCKGIDLNSNGSLSNERLQAARGAVSQVWQRHGQTPVPN